MIELIKIQPGGSQEHMRDVYYQSKINECFSAINEQEEKIKLLHKRIEELEGNINE
jgi:hypothetical protein